VSYLQAFVIALVQGLTELFPVSSLAGERLRRARPDARAPAEAPAAATAPRPASPGAHARHAEGRDATRKARLARRPCGTLAHRSGHNRLPDRQAARAAQVKPRPSSAA